MNTSFHDISKIYGIKNYKSVINDLSRKLNFGRIEQ
jgi:hypothetical protein